MKFSFKSLLVIFSVALLFSCKKEEVESSYPAVEAKFSDRIDLNNLQDYEGQTKPAYILKDNSGSNSIKNSVATLGRVLFYDKNLSVNNTISCSSCHKQSLAFSDNNVTSIGVNGQTGRHSMRLVNARFSNEVKFFWDERAASLEEQTTKPIQDHAEMGFSGQNGDPSIADLIEKLQALDYYKELFKFTFLTEEISEAKIQIALAQFIRSIQSFDSKYDIGRALAPNDGANFTNFSALENQGKNLFLAPPQFGAGGNRVGGGAGCAGCHQPPEFDIVANTLNNGVVSVAANASAIDLTNTKSPSLRDIFGTSGNLNGQLMHNGAFTTVAQVIEHYNNIPNDATNTNLDPKLRPGGQTQKLQLTADEKLALEAFLKTLSGTDMYTNAKWSDPF
ncbi:MAG: cytochrome c peroxidase [Bacteroidota bacterium]